MRVENAKAEKAYFIHKLYTQFRQDLGLEGPVGIEMWLNKFSDQDFFVLLGLHGKKPVNMVWGSRNKDNPKELSIEGLFMTRGFRGAKSVRFLRPLCIALKEHLRHNGIKRITTALPKIRKGFKPVAIVGGKNVRSK